MPRFLPPTRLTGATILRDGMMQRRSVAIADGRITKGPLPAVNLSGYLILPGIVDLHGDAFERHIAPRPSAPFPIETGLRATDRDAAAHGVTTAWLAQSWSWEGGARAPEYAEDLLRAHAAYRAEMLTDLRVQIRCETHTVNTAERLLSLVEEFGVDYVVFNNHLGEALAMARDDPDRLAAGASRAGRSPQEHLAQIHAARDQAREVPRYLCRLAEAFDRRGVLYGSHDDPDGNTRETYSLIGARICEFPTTRAPAALARAVNDPVIMGAPNVVRGNSQAGNIRAVDLIHDGLCSALVSDYYYPSLAQAAFRLVDSGLLDLPRAWALISETPAQILRLADRGRIDIGKRADLAIVNEKTRIVEATICNGRITHLAGEAAHRFLSGETDLHLAAE
ncbi:alpha-D-ribose 1-methylphosphonate 5-triphosphate diphosphatase [Salinihabitans flavidus]|uniref:Alpha-D-ribose 1-methylphosphonate 5-triphosphate diphosphatase n=1 Tax=Salinihabitans flavidus TaxID=569882 RepID=A0A1H8QVU3_9RHOB|nr:alpha-D-ribose 1-methylphosphonate 5-triphosphate diphosphatase [Salinihabitans flavidus]SEO58166.1 alpha-D-ribose 1-methylphosphonate 5-triphosphate diphosphatase [Salinihabitans flavidus]